MVHVLDSASGTVRRPGALTAVRTELAGMAGCRHPARETVPLGVMDVDTSLPGRGLSLAALHEIAGVGTSGFTAALAGRIARQRSGLVVWCQHRRRMLDEGALYGPGLAAFGLAAERFLRVDAGDDGETLWAMEEALRSPAAAVVVAEVETIDLFRTRRLQLAAEVGGGAGLLLRPARPRLEPSAAVTRWRVRPVFRPSPWPGELGPLAWNAELWRIKGGVPSSFEVCFDESTLRFALVADLARGSVSAGSAARG
jgi:protein ImuA